VKVIEIHTRDTNCNFSLTMEKYEINIKSVLKNVKILQMIPKSLKDCENT
jgi:hypothetical protein